MSSHKFMEVSCKRVWDISRLLRLITLMFLCIVFFNSLPLMNLPCWQFYPDLYLFMRLLTCIYMYKCLYKKKLWNYWILCRTVGLQVETISVYIQACHLVRCPNINFIVKTFKTALFCTCTHDGRDDQQCEMAWRIYRSASQHEISLNYAV